MKEELEKVKKLLKKYGQEHLLLKYDEMDEEDQRELLIQINEIDFDLMNELYEKALSRMNYEISFDFNINKENKKEVNDYLYRFVRNNKNGKYKIKKE